MWYFEPIDRQLKLKASIDSWMGTPFRHRSGVKGLNGGVDCIHFVAEVFKEVGLIDHYEVPKYAKDWHLHKTGERLLLGVLDLGKSHPTHNLVNVGIKNPMNGDIIFFRWGRAAAHISIYYDKRIYQVLAGLRVESRPWMEDHSRKQFGLRVEE